MIINRRQLAVDCDCENHARFLRVAESRNMTISALLCEIVDQVINPAPPDTEMLGTIAGHKRTLAYRPLALNVPLKCRPKANRLTIVRASCRTKVLEVGQ